MYETVVGPQGEDLSELSRGLYEFNSAIIGPQEYTPLGVYVRDEGAKLIGGIYGEIGWDWLHIKRLWVAEEHRGAGIGAKLLRMAEEAAVSRGIDRAHLETTGFQARGFYEKNGYRVFAVLEDKPPGSCFIYLKKEKLGEHSCAELG